MLLVLAMSLALPALSAEPCRPNGANGSAGTLDHWRLRSEMGVAMPTTKTMVMLFGSGGHHVTRSYSIVVARGDDGVWRGTAVGQDTPWVGSGSATPLPDAAWTLDATAGKALDRALARPCAPRAPTVDGSWQDAPAIGAIGERLDVVIDGKVVGSAAVGADGESLSPLVRKP